MGSAMKDAAPASLHVLVVDDSKLMIAYYRKTLAELPNHDVAFATNGWEALKHVWAHGEPDVLILDINMPTMNGLEFLRHFRETWPDARTRVVIVSTESSEDDRRRAHEAGAQGYLKKPFEIEALRALFVRPPA